MKRSAGIILVLYTQHSATPQRDLKKLSSVTLWVNWIVHLTVAAGVILTAGQPPVATSLDAKLCSHAPSSSLDANGSTALATSPTSAL